MGILEYVLLCNDGQIHPAGIMQPDHAHTHTDYGHKKAKSQILCGPNSNQIGYKDLVFL